MPELPEVEVLRRHLAPLLIGKTIRAIEVHKFRIVRPGPPVALQKKVAGGLIEAVQRRGKFLLFGLRRREEKILTLVIHLGMTGRLFVQPATRPLPMHVAAVFQVGRNAMVFKDTRGFGRITLDLGTINTMGPEPLEDGFSAEKLANGLASRQTVKARLMNQSVVAGLGNIYACEALHHAGISPNARAEKLGPVRIRRLHDAILKILGEAVDFGSDLDLDWEGSEPGDGLFYFGGKEGTFSQGGLIERFRVYGREGEPCGGCGTRIRRIEQNGRGTFYCPRCQKQ